MAIEVEFYNVGAWNNVRHNPIEGAMKTDT